MATFSKRKNKSGWVHKAEVNIKGKRISRTFNSKADARDWAAAEEINIETPEHSTVAKGIEKYLAEYSIHKKSAAWEKKRYAALLKYPLAEVRFSDLDAAPCADFRNARLAEGVSNNTVLRDLSLFSAVFTKAVKEWGWLRVNPLLDMPKLKPGKGRDRLITNPEIEKICDALGYTFGKPTTPNHLVAIMFRLAIETGMRLGEIAKLTPEAVTIKKVNGFEIGYVTLHDTKSGDDRDVPLTPDAIRLVNWAGRRFPIKTSAVTKAFASAVKRAGIGANSKGETVRFHDTRHLACTRMAKKFDMPTLMRILGHSNSKMTMKYFRRNAADIALEMAMEHENNIVKMTVVK